MSQEQTALEQLVGDGKKFQDVEGLAKGKLESDAFITRIQTENQTLRTELENALKSADTTAALEKLMTELNKQTPPGGHDDKPPTDRKDNQNPSLSQDDIVKIIEAREAEKKQERNLADALAKFEKVFGEKTAEVLETKANELGLSVEELKNLAKRSPAAFTNTVGIGTQDSSTRSMSRGGRSPAPEAPGGAVRNKAYYEKLRTEMGTTKFVLDRNLQVQLHRDMMSLGDAWD